MNLNALILLALLLFPQAPQRIKIIPKFEVGETFHLEIRKAREDSRNPSTGFSITAVDVVVRNVDVDGFDLEWVYGETRVQTERESANPTINLNTDFKNLRLDIRLKRDGGFYLRNANDVFDGIQAAIDAMITRAVLPLAEVQRKQIADSVRVLVTPEWERAFVMRDVRLFLGSYGFELQPGMSFEKTAPVLNPVASGTVDSTVRAELNRIDDDDAHITVELQYPPEVAAMIASGAKPPIVLPNPTDMLRAQVADRTDLLYVVREGFFRDIRHQFGITAGSFRRVDRTEMSVTKQ